MRAQKQIPPPQSQKGPAKYFFKGIEAFKQRNLAKLKQKMVQAWQKAASEFIEGGDFKSAALIFENIHDMPKADEMWLRYAKSEEQKNNFQEAASAYKKLGNFKKIEENLLNHAKELEGFNNYLEAAKIYYYLGKNDLAKITCFRGIRQAQKQNDLENLYKLFDFLIKIQPDK